VSFVEENEPKKQRAGPTFESRIDLDTLEADNPVQIWCNSINKDSTNEDAKVYVRKVLERSESRANQQAADLLGESSIPPPNLPTHVSPRERAADPEAEANKETEGCVEEEEPQVDCRVGGGPKEPIDSEGPVCCISQGMFLLRVF
jgi:hypothetical protein